MGSMKKWMLAAALAVGAVGLGATSAQAAEFGIYARGPVAYVPPCPGPGYYWIAGYRANGYWIPGRWSYGGGRVVVGRGYFVRGREFGPRFYRGYGPFRR